jgi:hypothetical protein
MVAALMPQASGTSKPGQIRDLRHPFHPQKRAGAVGFNVAMTDLARPGIRPAQHLSIKDDATSDPRRDCHIEQRRAALAGAEAKFTEHRRLRLNLVPPMSTARLFQSGWTA